MTTFTHTLLQLTLAAVQIILASISEWRLVVMFAMMMAGVHLGFMVSAWLLSASERNC